MGVGWVLDMGKERQNMCVPLHHGLCVNVWGQPCGVALLFHTGSGD